MYLYICMGVLGMGDMGGRVTVDSIIIVNSKQECAPVCTCLFVCHCFATKVFIG